MKPLSAFLAAAAMAAAMCASAAASAPPAPALLARVAQPGGELALLGQSPGPFSLPRKDLAAELRFTNRDGYRFTLVAFGQTIALTVGKGREDLSGAAAGRFSTTTYLAHGQATPTSIRASFGDRGRIALRFRPSGREIHASRHAGCRRPGNRPIARLGVFVGELRFRGEGGYTSVDAHRVHGGTVDLAALGSCRPEGDLPGLAGQSARRAESTSPAVPTHPSRGPKRTSLFASLKLPLSRTVFEARLSGLGSTRFLAAEEATEGQIGTVRLAGVSASSSAFTFDDTLANAAIAPPAPFSGKGVFQQGIGSMKSWTGSLAVSFLGAPKVPLAGSPFKARLSQNW